MIQLKNVFRTYRLGDQVVHALNDVNLEIQKGDYVAIMGPSGSGKSTLMNVLGLLDLPDQGEFFVDGINTLGLDDKEISTLRRNTVGFIFQQFHLLPKLTAEENVELPHFYSQLLIEKNYVTSLLEKVQLGHRKDHSPLELSGGQQQRVAIARAMVNRPLLLLADEPTGNLDSQSEQEILKIFDDLNEQGMTIVVVTHEEEVGERARRVIRMRDGVIQSDVRQKSIPLSSSTLIEGNHSKNYQQDRIYKKKSSFETLKTYFQQGLRNLFVNKMRSILSILGILIGVSSVITMMAFGRGADDAIQRQLQSLGSNLLLLKTNDLTGNGPKKLESFTPPSPKDVGVRAKTPPPESKIQFTIEDTEAIKELISHVVDSSALIEAKVQVSFENQNRFTQLLGVSSEYLDMHHLELPWGRFFSEDENSTRERVAVIGQRVVDTLFFDKNPIGEFLKINKQNFRIIGILPEKGLMGQNDLDDRVIVPVQSAQARLLGTSAVDMIEVSVDKSENMPQVENDLLGIMYQRHQVPFSQRDKAFKVQNMADLQKALSKSSKTMSQLLLAIAAISLLVGGIGIMNIMLVSVTERTKEIGIRKSLGAMKRDILFQFVTESIVISSFGGILGIFLGIVFSLGLRYAFSQNLLVGGDSILISFGFSTIIGLVFGIVPAQKASQLKPIEALRGS